MGRIRTAKLTAKAVEAITEPGRHGDGDGLYLTVAKGGTKSWTFLYRFGPVRREMGLGSVSKVTLAEARRLAGESRVQLNRGIDPVAARAAGALPASDEQAPVLFKAFAEQHLAMKAAGWSNGKHHYQWQMALGKFSEPLHRMPIADIETADILAVLKPHWLRAPETASRLRGRLESVLDAAKALGLRTGENPARWRGHLSNLLPARRRLTRGHHPAMPYADVPAFMATLREKRSVTTAALEFTILTAVRSGEARLATWSEIDFLARTWTIPGGRTKTKKPHVVPLAPRALEILEEAKHWRASRDDLIFPGSRPRVPLSDMSLISALRKRKLAFTVHGFRSSFRDWAGDATDFPRELAEQALAHNIGNDVERAYRRSTALERRRILMNDWSTFCGSGATANVLPFAKSA